MPGKKTKTPRSSYKHQHVGVCDGSWGLMIDQSHQDSKHLACIEGKHGKATNSDGLHSDDLQPSSDDLHPRHHRHGKASTSRQDIEGVRLSSHEHSNIPPCVWISRVLRRFSTFQVGPFWSMFSPPSPGWATRRISS